MDCSSSMNDPIHKRLFDNIHCVIGDVALHPRASQFDVRARSTAEPVRGILEADGIVGEGNRLEDTALALVCVSVLGRQGGADAVEAFLSSGGSDVHNN